MPSSESNTHNHQTPSNIHDVPAGMNGELTSPPVTGMIWVSSPEHIASVELGGMPWTKRLYSSTPKVGWQLEE